MKHTRVVHVINSLNRGGAEGMLVRLLQPLSEQADEQHIVVTLLSGGPLRSTLDPLDVEVYELGFDRHRPTPTAAWRAIRLLRELEPQVVVAWLYQSAALATVAHPLIGRPRLIWNLRGAAKDRSQSTMNNRLTVRLLTAMSHRPWAVGVNSRAGRSEHHALGFRPRRWAYLPNGFTTPPRRTDDAKRSELRAQLAINEADVAVVSIARAEPDKDHPTLLRAAEQFLPAEPSARLLLIGRGTDQLTIAPAIRDRVTALGERDDVPRLLAACDLGVLSSSTEGLPNSVAESMLAELPCVVTDVGDCAELVGPTGRVVPARSPDALASAVLDMVRLQAGDRQNLGALARQRVIDRYSMDRCVTAYRRLWADLPGTSTSA